MKTKSSIWFVVLLAGMSCSSYATGVPNFTIERVTEEASLILVGDIAEVKELGVAPPLQFRGQWLQGNAYSVDISVRRTIKGPILDHITVTYTLPTVFNGYRGLQTGTRIVFLSGQGKTVRLANPYYPDFPAVPDTVASETPSLDPAGSVLREMLRVLESPEASTSDKYQILGIDDALPADGKTVGALRRALTSSRDDPEFAEKVQGELIRFGDISELPNIANLLLEGTATQSGREWLLYTTGNHLKAPQAVPALRSLLRAPDDSVREAATQALWHINDRSTIDLLIKSLDDPDEKVRFYAVRGLSDIVNEVGWGGPSESEFHDHQQKYGTHWKEWANSRGVQ
jgi:hypothetical protein